ncbi:MAG: hypothetical protein ACE5ET_04090 [Gammaproteobacteria bacterium]
MSTIELAEARDIVQSLLDELGLQAYLFEIEPREQDWELRIDCAINGEWQSTRLQVAPQRLQACRSDCAARESLLAQWRPHLEYCRRGE